MHTQPVPSQLLGSSVPIPVPHRRRYREPASEEVKILRLICEQTAIPFDQLVCFLGSSVEMVRGMVDRLGEMGCIESRCFFANDQPWYWLTYRGVRLAGLGFRYKAPSVWQLTHRRAVNAVRLHLANRVPEGRWLSERLVCRQLDRSALVPDAVFEIGGERHAIEVELTRKKELRQRLVLDEHSARYNAVVYFCGPRTWSLLDRLQEEGRWPNLRVFELPEGC